MVRFTRHSLTSALQERLDREAAAGVERIRGGDDIVAPPRQWDDRLTFGPYGTSPISGLHFELVDDPAAS
jgi:hypothetical protein